MCPLKILYFFMFICHTVSNFSGNIMEDRVRAACARYTKRTLKLQSHRIVGGSDANINDYAYQANYDDRCGGALIHKKWVLTASHCNVGGNFVRLGASARNSGRKFVIIRHIRHPNWTMPRKHHLFDYDLQLLEIRRPLKVKKGIKPIKVGTADMVTPGDYLTITGWGNIKEKGPPAETLQFVQLPIVNQNDCNKIKNEFFNGTLTDRMFCAGFNTTKSDRQYGKDACQGDSGGPAMMNNKLVGIVSFGVGCGRNNFPGVYTNVPLFLPWILNVTKLKMSDIT